MAHSSETRPRVLYLINALTVGGAEIGIANLLARGFFDGVELRLVTLWSPAVILLDAYPILQPFSHDVLLPGRKGGAAGYAVALQRLLGLVRRWRPQVLVCSLAQSVLLGRAIKLAHPRLRLITFEHNARLRSAIATRVVKATSWCCDGVWADSPATLNSVIHRHHYSSRTPSAIVRLQEISDCLSTPPPRFDPAAMRLLFVGRLSEQKRVEACIRALALVDEAPVTLDIIGDGELMATLQSVVETLGLGSRVAFHGFQVDWPMRVAGQGYIGLLASSREGFAITALQMLALGLPLVTTAAGEVKTYVQDAVNGFVLDGGEPAQIAAGYRRAWAACQAWPTMAIAARASAQAFQARMEAEFSDDAARAMMFTPTDG